MKRPTVSEVFVGFGLGFVSFYLFHAAAEALRLVRAEITARLVRSIMFCQRSKDYKMLGEN